MILAGVVEEEAELPRYAEALDGSRVLLCRLIVDLDVVRERLQRRHRNEPEDLAWHLDRTSELTDLLDADPFEDVRTDTTGRTPADVARAVQRAAGWER
jgi:chloramphenicol 3-O-phosphotransferase